MFAAQCDATGDCSTCGGNGTIETEKELTDQERAAETRSDWIAWFTQASDEEILRFQRLIDNALRIQELLQANTPNDVTPSA